MTSDSVSRPQVILSANVSHYYYTAVALRQAGYLKRYICAIGINSHKLLQRFLLRKLPKGSLKKLANRDITEFEPRTVRAIWSPELLQRGLPATGLISLDRGNWIAAHTFDWLASWSIDACDIFHFVSSIGLYSARRARSQGSIVVCDERSEYPDFQEQVLREEYARLGLEYNPLGRLTESKVRAEYTLSDYFIVASSYAKQTYLEAGIDEGKIFVVPYGVDLDQFNQMKDDSGVGSEKSYTQDKVFRIIFAGQLVPRKGVHYLIQAFKELDLLDSELWLVGAGDGSLDKYMQNHVSNDPRIKLLGLVPKIDLFRYYNQADVFVLPSLADSYGLVTLEAMACGLPVIVTENTGSKEAVRDGIDGFIIPIRDADALKEKLNLLYENPQYRREMGQSAANRVKLFTWDKYGDRILAVYDEIMLRKQRELVSSNERTR